MECLRDQSNSQQSQNKAQKYRPGGAQTRRHRTYTTRTHLFNSKRGSTRRARELFYVEKAKTMYHMVQIKLRRRVLTFYTSLLLLPHS